MPSSSAREGGDNGGGKKVEGDVKAGEEGGGPFPGSLLKRDWTGGISIQDRRGRGGGGARDSLRPCPVLPSLGLFQGKLGKDMAEERQKRLLVSSSLHSFCFALGLFFPEKHRRLFICSTCFAMNYLLSAIFFSGFVLGLSH